MMERRRGEREKEREGEERGRVDSGRGSRPNKVRTGLHALIRKFSQSALLCSVTDAPGALWVAADVLWS